ncbi:hypothetical protein GQR36_12620 [Enterococcus termitis]
MLVLKHAFLNLKRHRWQHLLLGSLLFLLIFTTMTAYTLLHQPDDLPNSMKDNSSQL